MAKSKRTTTGKRKLVASNLWGVPHILEGSGIVDKPDKTGKVHYYDWSTNSVKTDTLQPGEYMTSHEAWMTCDGGEGVSMPDSILVEASKTKWKIVNGKLQGTSLGKIQKSRNPNDYYCTKPGSDLSIYKTKKK